MAVTAFGKAAGGGGGGGGGSRAVLSAAKRAMIRHPAYAFKGSIVNSQIKAKVTPAASSNLGKFLALRDPPRSDISRLITKFIKLHNRENPGMKKNLLTEEKLRAFLAGKERIGIPEITKLLSQQFIKSG